jgi:hypothetical protein
MEWNGMEMGNGIRNKMLTDWKWSGSKMVVERNVIVTE